ncbi:MAG TPA: HlyD family efflux transporter periplasmic adaptor subunit [Allosphingosinicella sp.]
MTVDPVAENAGAGKPRLFRAAAMNEFERRGAGEPILQQPPNFTTYLIAISILCAALFAFVALATWPAVHTASGYVIPSRSPIEIYPSGSGVVIAIAAPGSRVRAGQPLARLSADTSSLTGSGTAEARLQALESQRQANSNEIRLVDMDRKSRLAQLDSEQALLAARIENLRRQSAIANARIANAEQDVAASRTLVDKGYMAAHEMRRRQNLLLEARQAITVLDLEAVAARNRLRAIAFEKDSISASFSRQAESLRAESFARSGEIATARLAVGETVVAPVSGRVASNEVQVGQRVDKRARLAILLPEATRLQIELALPSRAAGRIAPGQRVSLDFDSYPAAKYGRQTAVVSSVEPIATRSSAGAIAGARTEPEFRILVRPDRDVIAYDGQTYPLRPGMKVRARIVIERRTLLAWLLSPFKTFG